MGGVAFERGGVEAFDEALAYLTCFLKEFLLDLIYRILGCVEEVVVAHEKYGVYPFAGKGLVVAPRVGGECAVLRGDV